MTRNRRHFTDEFKREAVRLAEQPCSNVSQVAMDLGLDPSVLRRWVGQMRVGIWEPTDGKLLRVTPFRKLINPSPRPAHDRQEVDHVQ